LADADRDRRHVPEVADGAVPVPDLHDVAETDS
jgi:hypothetical protein